MASLYRRKNDFVISQPLLPKKDPNGVRRLLWNILNRSSLLSRSEQLYKYQIIFLYA
jgi:hypothetical protein